MALGVGGHPGSVSVAWAEKEKEKDAVKAYRKPLSAQLLPPKASTSALLGNSPPGSLGPPFPPPRTKLPAELSITSAPHLRLTDTIYEGLVQLPER
jgi:hypothetical protein